MNPSGCSTQQSISYMLTWMNSSPYYATSLYLPSPNHTSDGNLNAAWVSGVLSQGWSLIPIWVGAQSPCACKPNTGTYPNCTPFNTVISNTTAAATAQGKADAKTAEARAAALGAGGVIIYKDIENYNPASVLSNGVSCGSVVNAYLSGWDTQLQGDSYYSGAYGNPTPIVSWWSNVVPLPNDIWIAQANSQVSVWNVGTKYKMTDNMWPNSQRIHQYNAGPPHTESWGADTPSFTTDDDIVDAPIFNGNAVPKTYTYNAPTDISCAGSINTYPTAINDMSNGSFINGPGQTGTVVGMVQSTIGAPNQAFQNVGGTCTTLNIFGSNVAEATGINNLGQIVGYFQDSNGAYHGFLVNAGGTATQIDYSYNGQTAVATYLYGINDAGQAVGYAYSPATFYYQSFMYYGGQFYPFGVSNSNFEYTLARAVNGQGTVTGTYYYEPLTEDFEMTSAPPSWAGVVNGMTPGGSPNTLALGIDANDELTGYYYSSSCSNADNECGFEWPSGLAGFNVLTYGPVDSAAEGINDFAQIVGAYTNSSTQYSHGLWWAHQ